MSSADHKHDLALKERLFANKKVGSSPTPNTHKEFENLAKGILQTFVKKKVAKSDY